MHIVTQVPELPEPASPRNGDIASTLLQGNQFESVVCLHHSNHSWTGYIVAEDNDKEVTLFSITAALPYTLLQELPRKIRAVGFKNYNSIDINPTDQVPSMSCLKLLLTWLFFRPCCKPTVSAHADVRLVMKQL